MKTTVNQLRAEGYKVRVGHKRRYRKGKYAPCLFKTEAIEQGFTQPLPKGGLTVLKLTTPTGQEIESNAACSHKDSYNRKLGVQIAIGRALLQEYHQNPASVRIHEKINNKECGRISS